MAASATRPAALAVALLACGGQAGLGADASVLDGSISHPDATRDSASTGPPETTTSSDGGAGEDAVVAATDAACGDAALFEAGVSCDPFPCAPGQFCLNLIGTISGKHSYCQAIPDCCEPSPDCICILQAVACAHQCVADGGGMTATCIIPQKGPPK